jgi:hypothetical protein
MLKKFLFTQIIATTCLVANDDPRKAQKIFPSETFLMEMPQKGQKWKDISRYISSIAAQIECIPFDQNEKNWSELIAIQFFRIRGGCLKDIISEVKETALSSYPGTKVTWNILEEAENEVIYEWTIHEPFLSVPPQYEVAKAMLSPRGFHRIGYTVRNKEVTDQRKAELTKLIRKNTRVVSFSEAERLPETISCVDRAHRSAGLGETYKD